MILAAIHCQKANFRQWVTSLMRCEHIVDCIVVVVLMVVALVHTHVTVNHHEPRSSQPCESFYSMTFVTNHCQKAIFRQWVTSLIR